MAPEGRDLDAAVCRALGKACERRVPDVPISDDEPDWCTPAPPALAGVREVWLPAPRYSADPAAALAALEAFCEARNAGGGDWCVTLSESPPSRRRRGGGPFPPPAWPRWAVLIDGGRRPAGGEADALPLAACRAILAAAGEGGGG